MVRHYKKKKPHRYDKQKLLQAVQAVTKQGVSLRKAAGLFNIPFATLRLHVVHPNMKVGSGVSTLLSETEEDHLAHALVYLAKCGVPQGRREIKQIVCSFVTSLGRDNRFKENIPGKDWIKGFETRNKAVLTKRKPEILTVARSKALTNEVVDEFFKKWEALIKKHMFQDDPGRVFNCDETGLNTNPVHGKVYVGRKSKDAYIKTPNCGKTMYSVLFCASATGIFLPPFTVYKSKNLYDTWTKGGPKDAGYGCSESGWMQDFNFESWFISMFIPFVMNYEKPVLLTFDGHNSHLTYNTVKHAMDNEIILFCLPPNTSHALQPLDVGVFKSVKANWRIILTDWFKDSRLRTVDKAVFPILLAKLCLLLNPRHVVNGFRGSGLLPVDRTAVQHRVLAESSQEEGEGNQVMTPRTVLRLAILKTVSPDPDLQAPSGTRRRVQHKSGEILTEDEVLSRLEEEENNRKEKKKKGPKAAKSRSNKNYKKKTVDEMFLERLARPGSSLDDAFENIITADENSENEFGAMEATGVEIEFNNNKVDTRMLEEGVTHVLTQYEGSYFPGLVIKLKKKTIEVSCMQKNGLFGWKWPQVSDIHQYPLEDIVKVIGKPKALNKRNNYSVPEADDYWE